MPTLPYEFARTQRLSLMSAASLDVLCLRQYIDCDSQFLDRLQRDPTQQEGVR